MTTDSELSGCACVSHDARQCYLIRYNLIDFEAREQGDFYRCECDCHQEYSDDDEG